MTETTPTPTDEQATGVITQKQLQDLKNLRDAKNLIQKQADARRSEILAAYRAEAEVEPGKYGLKVRDSERQALTPSNVAAVVGDQMLNEILSTIEPMTSSTVLVVDSPTRPLDPLNDNRPDLLDEWLAEEQGHGVSVKELLTAPVSEEGDFH